VFVDSAETISPMPSEARLTSVTTPNQSTSIRVPPGISSRIATTPTSAADWNRANTLSASTLDKTYGTIARLTRRSRA
jgi:hypothetical protein